MEQAIAREALRLALDQHRQLAVGLKGVQSERSLSDIFDQSATGESLIRLMDLDLLVGSGGVLSHAPDRRQSAAILIDAFQPEGVTRLAVDSIFMMPHLGVLSAVDEEAAAQVFERDCLIYLGTCVALSGQGRPGELCAEYELTAQSGAQSGELAYGELKAFALADGEEADLVIRPGKQWDAGEGSGREVSARVHGGAAGVLLDGRGRPIRFADSEEERVPQVTEWTGTLELYTK